MSFTAIETQEQLDQIIGERLKREREKLEKEYAAYISPENLDAKLKEYKDKEDMLNKSIQEMQDKLSTYATDIDEKEARLKKYETSSVKMRIAKEVGLPFDAADFLSGDDEQTIKDNAEVLKALIEKPQMSLPLAETENPPTGDEALRNTLRNLKGE